LREQLCEAHWQWLVPQEARNLVTSVLIDVRGELFVSWGETTPATEAIESTGTRYPTWKEFIPEGWLVETDDRYDDLPPCGRLKFFSRETTNVENPARDTDVYWNLDGGWWDGPEPDNKTELAGCYTALWAHEALELVAVAEAPRPDMPEAVTWVKAHLTGPVAEERVIRYAGEPWAAHPLWPHRWVDGDGLTSRDVSGHMSFVSGARHTENYLAGF
jgi:hypothetical protein